MATDPSPPLELNTYSARRDRTAGTRILRQFAIFIGSGYFFYGVVLIPTLLESLDAMAPWWTALAVSVVVAACIGLIWCGFRGPVDRIPEVALAAVVAYLICLGLFRFGWTGGHVNEPIGLWFSQIGVVTALASTLIGRAAWAFAFLGIVMFAAPAANNTIRPDAINAPFVPSAAWYVCYLLLPISAAIIGIRTARILDSTRDDAYAAVSRTTAAEAKAAERERFNLLTHDRVMATLLDAARRGNSPQLAAQAAATIHAIEDLHDEPDLDRRVDRDRAVGEIRAAVALAAPHSTVAVAVCPDAGTFPAVAAESVAAATAEAARNSLRHAGSGARIHVAISAGRDVLTAQITDDGDGFDPAAVTGGRLGIANSIRGRMAALPGGSAQVRSDPGAGTTVDVEWRAV